MFKHTFRQGEARLIYFAGPDTPNQENFDGKHEVKDFVLLDGAEKVDQQMDLRKDDAEDHVQKWGKKIDDTKKTIDNVVFTGINAIPKIRDEIVRMGDTPLPISINIPGTSLNNTDSNSDSAMKNEGGATATAKAKAEATAQGGNVTINNFNQPEAVKRITENEDRRLVASLWQRYVADMSEIDKNPRNTMDEKKVKQLDLIADMSTKLEAKNSHFGVRLMPNSTIPIIYQKESFTTRTGFNVARLDEFSAPAVERIANVYRTINMKNMPQLVKRLNEATANVALPNQPPVRVTWIAGRDGLPPMPVSTPEIRPTPRALPVQRDTNGILVNNKNPSSAAGE